MTIIRGAPVRFVVGSARYPGKIRLLFKTHGEAVKTRGRLGEAIWGIRKDGTFVRCQLWRRHKAWNYY